MKRDPPPPVIDSSRVLSYAFVDDIPYRRAGALYVDGQPLEHVPRLAICTKDDWRKLHATTRRIS